MSASTYPSTLLIKVATPGRNYEVNVSYESEGEPVGLAIDVPNPSTDKEVNVPIDVSQIQCLLLIATVEMTIEINDGTSPDQTITLGGDNELWMLWTVDDQDDCPLDQDVTKFFVTQSSGEDGILYVFCAQDITP